MAVHSKVSRQRRIRRHRSIRKRIEGTAERPRLNVFRSSNHIYVQLIDDTKGHTVAAASSRETSVQAGKKTERSRRVGELAAERALSVGISRVVFDRGGYLYHGRVKAVADGARAGGLEF
jgi:large subunit ribosomal protein L18